MLNEYSTCHSFAPEKVLIYRNYEIFCRWSRDKWYHSIAKQVAHMYTVNVTKKKNRLGHQCLLWRHRYRLARVQILNLNIVYLIYLSLLKHLFTYSNRHAAKLQAPCILRSKSGMQFSASFNHLLPTVTNSATILTCFTILFLREIKELAIEFRK